MRRWDLPELLHGVSRELTSALFISSHCSHTELRARVGTGGRWLVTETKAELIWSMSQREQAITFNLLNSKASNSNHSLCISSSFHLRISEGLWNFHPTMWDVIICSHRIREEAGCSVSSLQGWFKAPMRFCVLSIAFLILTNTTNGSAKLQKPEQHP